MKEFRKKILIDLDGVLNEYTGNYYDEYIPNIKNGAIDFIKKFSKCADLYLFTSRNLLLSAKWLINNNIDCYFKDITNIKIPSHLYIDDRCIRFNGDYEDTIKDIEQFNAYWNNPD